MQLELAEGQHSGKKWAEEAFLLPFVHGPCSGGQLVTTILKWKLLGWQAEGC